MSGDVKVTEVAGSECGDVKLKRFLAITLEGRVAREVQQKELYQGEETSGGKIPLHCPEVAWPVLLSMRCHAEKRVEDCDRIFGIDLQEVKTIKFL